MKSRKIMKQNAITRRAFILTSIALAAFALSSFATVLAAERPMAKPDGKPADIKKPIVTATMGLLNETKCYGVQMAVGQPEFAAFWVDSLGKRRKWHNAMLGGNLKQSYRKESSDGWVNYHPVAQADALTGFKFDDSSIRIRSEARAHDAVEPFVMKFNLKGRYPAFATLLGRMEKDGEVNLPAVLHIPGQGTVRITARSEKAMPLRLKYESEKKFVSEEEGNRQFVKITFPAASEECNWVEFRLDVVNIYPKIQGLENDERFDGYCRCWLNILQLTPERRMLANNAVSDVCSLVYHEYSEIAALTGELADGVTGLTLLRDSLNRFLDEGELGYGMAKYKGEPYYPEASLDTWPSLLIAAHNYYQASGDQQWLERHIDKLTKWGEESLATDKDGNGLIEYHQSGNAGDCHFRPANWWDAINFGHEDAYSNALAYRAFRGLALMEKKAGRDEQAARFEKAAEKLKAAYYKTFFNPETGMLAGWKSRDGKLHDYGFTFIQGLAIAYGLIDDAATANQLLDATLKKIKDVGFNRFDLGLPGNLVAIPPEDYFQKFMKPGWDKQRHPFQTYENGGTSANHTYYLISALYQHGRIKDGDMILLPILKSFNEGGFAGYKGPWLSYDWMSWDGKPHGYEGLLVDNYLAVKAVLVRQGLVDPAWGCLKNINPRLDQYPSAAPPAETKEARDTRMAWWRDARFGMFVVVGPYSGLAGTWEGKPVATHGNMEWIQECVHADTETYAKAALPLFKPKPGTAREWARLARTAGCRYIVFTTKFHDGFAMFDSKVSDFNSVALLQRDIVKEYVDACRAEGLRVGFYHSVIDWHHDQYEYRRSTRLPHPLKGMPYPNGQRDHAKYVDYLHAQVNELMSNYGQVDVLWFDYSALEFQGQEAWRAFDLMKMVREKQPGIIINNRLFRSEEAGWNINTGVGGTKLDTRYGDFITPEQYIPATGMPGVDWETCMTMNTTWGYSDHDHAWKSSELLIRKLVDIASKGGNFLLNIGPKGDGSIPQASIDSMEAIGRWMKVNSEAIYGTSATVFGVELGKAVKGKTGDGKEVLVSSSDDWRCTTKPGKIYLHLFKWPADSKFEVPGLQSKVTKAYLLVDRKDLKVEQNAGGVSLALPAEAPDKIASVICLEIADPMAKVATPTTE